MLNKQIPKKMSTESISAEACNYLMVVEHNQCCLSIKSKEIFSSSLWYQLEFKGKPSTFFFLIFLHLYGNEMFPKTHLYQYLRQ